MSIENINWDKTGGPAFPATFDNSSNDIYIHGMSLRDWFAGMALQALIINPVLQEMTFEDYAGFAYDHAEAMLKERNDGEQP